ncbi:SidA/IucD/PvdA family monooxygenase [Nocardia xishanensis]|uniref:SidA/IucD/PvdA family monooxygenase n=1 Tax=Nocardia xishanensis TaxID=238964 RepID=UPI0034245AB3
MCRRARRPSSCARSACRTTRRASSSTSCSSPPSSTSSITPRPTCAAASSTKCTSPTTPGLAPPFLDDLYAMLYQQRMLGQERSTVRSMTEVAGARMDGDEVVLELRDRKTGKIEPLRCDVVLLGTGYEQQMPALVRDLAGRLGLDEISVSRRYRLDLGESAWGAVYLQGVNEQTHGISDTLISVLAHRSQDIVDDILDRRHVTAGAFPESRTA